MGTNRVRDDLASVTTTVRSTHALRPEANAPPSAPLRIVRLSAPAYTAAYPDPVRVDCADGGDDYFPTARAALEAYRARQSWYVDLDARLPGER